jgi:hypothetical protein
MRKSPKLAADAEFSSMSSSSGQSLPDLQEYVFDSSQVLQNIIFCSTQDDTCHFLGSSSSLALLAFVIFQLQFQHPSKLE